tara:strand:+ start:1235 stop:1729 length:495 start_codon:yes stop_codon:yes gene_type:complete
MIKKLSKEYDIFMFDLDRTVFDTFTKGGEPIWAKQMIQPLVKLDEDSVKDDCESECILQPGIRSVLKYLNSNGNKVGFISRGGVFNLEYEKQPSILLLKKLGIYDYFSYIKLMLYKTDIKANHLSEIGKCVFFDDMDKDLEEARKISDVVVIDRKEFKNWDDLL